MEMGHERGILAFDGNCGFCRVWIERWRAWTDGSVEAIPSGDAADAFPDLTPEDFERAVQYRDERGRVYSGADAVFRSLADAGGSAVPARLYDAIPVFRKLSEGAYRFIAARRPLFSRWTRLLWGADAAPPRYAFAARIFPSLLGGVYFCAFASFAVQIDGLLGAHGIGRAGPPLTGLSDAALRGFCWTGAGLAAALAAGFAPIPLLGVLWGMYFTLFQAAGIFLGYQWDLLLLEAGFLALFSAPVALLPGGGRSQPPRAGLWAARWLLFRLMLLSGAVKLLSGDPVWRDFSALAFHFESQPLPTRLAWAAHHLPAWIQQAAVFVLYAIELILPFFVFGPRMLRLAAAFGFLLLMALICATGNYTFFNLLTAALCVFLLDDAWLARRFPRLRAAAGSRAGRGRRSAALVFAAFVGIVGSAQLALRLIPNFPLSAPLFSVAALGSPLLTVNAYGLFAVMTTERNEIVLEGSDDGALWLEYEFKWKPGDPARPPGWAQPHQPRLDWQMWFAALSPYRQNPWFFAFLKRLLEGRPEVLGLLERNPFPDAPPKFIRPLFYRYRFAPSGAKEWWTRELLGLYAPPVALTPDGELALVMPAP
ncbi:MAG: hypothetical protein AUJ52_03700 [Elusimicrobia bacterium CG1_02_63_36]|nr:MAG: hypothetical protein AUJ52_03700 [Elusimicrobia bacterium CG1_02_63_36]PIP83433.1 MAG: hypothetical protein COR54_09905 [Elusimicrobia bacterium CG22_combo_CG10-13_8_21_14_all_63_91]PJA13497.1 MAG: hypothetical protein COX66_14855 [Elusimicrobia bacterium CG_4_10_14_0_2_um_filter_63_34]PJB25383.1 MAG: hypothetical protein CO113_09040 [Elusimicrobia bacterium CG_4_9_14_3_um_filter_62_55]